MALTEVAIRNAKPREKTYKLFDIDGLYLEISPAGGKWWRFKYRIEGREKRISLGTYPGTTLKEAREKRDDARRQVSRGIDPSAARQAEKSTASGGDTFGAIAVEWYQRRLPGWEKSHAQKVKLRMDKNAIPYLGPRSITSIEPPEILATLRRIEERGAIETAHRVSQIISQVFRYAVATGRATRDPTVDLRGALTPINPEHFATITNPKEIGELLRAIDGYQGSVIVRAALRLAPLLFVRPGELRRAEWSEVDLSKAEWRIPAHKMKMRSLHIVPLSKQAVAVMRDLQPLTGATAYLFPSPRSDERPISDVTLTAAIRRMGYTGDQLVIHGFRAMASTILHEQGWNSEVIERQLAHQERNKVKAAYNHAEHLPERRKMMQHWADFLDSLR